jgi:hypothetical protein
MIGVRYSGSRLSLLFSSLSHDVAHQATAHIAVYPGAVSASPAPREILLVHFPNCRQGAGPQQDPAVSKQPIIVSRLYLHPHLTNVSV